jgi:hypothetical protein
MGTRRDPRAEPSDPPTSGNIESERAPPPAMNVQPPSSDAQPPAQTPEPEIAPPIAAAATSRPADPPRAREAARVVTSADPRIEAVETALASGDWKKVAKELGPVEKAGALPPNLGLICAVAHHESSSDEGSTGANEVAIRCAAAIFGVPPNSALAVMLAKRLMRKNPVTWRHRPAPPARISILIVAITLAVGGGIGWLLSSGIVKLHVHF